MFEIRSWEQMIDCNFIHSGSLFVLVEEGVGQEAQQIDKYNLICNMNTIIQNVGLAVK